MYIYISICIYVCIYIYMYYIPIIISIICRYLLIYTVASFALWNHIIHECTVLCIVSMYHILNMVMVS